ncbi:hypothetical protein AQJ27_47815 [Streptomyces olivochromogenes]|nr:hypothetical protein AQJ27_47815 [Streptomyces olivochromogenes]
MIAAALAGSVVVPLAGAQPAAAADCLTSVPTYVWEPNTTGNMAAPRVLHKYMDWGPQIVTTDTLIDTLYTANLPTTSDPDTTGQIAKYSTGPWAQLDPEVRAGIVGTITADAGPRLADPDPSVRPYFTTPPDETGEVEAVDPAEEPAQTPSNTVTGKFTLGNGQPAAGLRVTLTANDLGDGATGQTQVPFPGMATTASISSGKADVFYSK